MPGRNIPVSEEPDSSYKSSSLKGHKTLPRPDPNYAVVRSRPQKSINKHGASTAATAKAISYSADQSPTPLLGGNASSGGFPPTPPINLQDPPKHGRFVEAAPSVKENSTSPTTQDSRLSTPINQLSPPTPDNTPPEDHPKLLLRVPRSRRKTSKTSSRTESFKTALETQSSSGDESTKSKSTPGRQDLSGNESGAGFSIKNSNADAGYQSEGGQGDFDNAATSTPEKSGRKSKKARKQKRIKFVEDQGQERRQGKQQTLSPEQGLNGGSPSSAAKRSGDHIRNGSQSRRDLARGPSLRERIQKNRESVDRRSAESFAVRISWPLAPDDFTVDGLPGVVDTRRFSQLSNASTVLEALVFPESPPVRPPLRHKRRLTSLRDEIFSRSGSVTPVATDQHPAKPPAPNELNAANIDELNVQLDRELNPTSSASQVELFD